MSLTICRSGHLPRDRIATANRTRISSEKWLLHHCLNSNSLWLPWASYQIRKNADCARAGNAGTFSLSTTSKEIASWQSRHAPRHVTHVPWCISGSLTRGGGENVPGILGRYYVSGKKPIPFVNNRCGGGSTFLELCTRLFGMVWHRSILQLFFDYHISSSPPVLHICRAVSGHPWLR